MPQFSAFTGRIYLEPCLVLAVGIFNFVVLPSEFVIVLVLQILWVATVPTSRPRQHPEGNGCLADCFVSWDTSGKNLTRSILAMS